MSAIDNIRRSLGRRRIITADEAMSIITAVAPGEGEERKRIMVEGLANDPGSILMWSPAGDGRTMRYDQPGTLTHTPELLMVARGLTVPRYPPYWHRALILRVRSAK